MKKQMQPADLLLLVPARSPHNNSQIVILAISTLDTQISKKIVILKIEGANILGKQYITDWGNSQVVRCTTWPSHLMNC